MSGVPVLSRAASRQSSYSARTTPSPETLTRTLPYGVSTSTDAALFTRRSARVDAQAERGGFREDDAAPASPDLPGARSRAAACRGGSFSSAAASERRVERAGFHQSLHGVAEHLRAGIVDVGFDHAHRGGFLGAAWFRRSARAGRWRVRGNRDRPRRIRWRSMRIGGSAPKSIASVAAMAAPVGVVNSMAGPRA